MDVNTPESRERLILHDGRFVGLRPENVQITSASQLVFPLLYNRPILKNSFLVYIFINLY